MARRSFEVTDLELMIWLAREEDALKLTGAALADYARTFAGNVEALASGREAARKFATWLTAITAKPDKLKEDWPSLAAAAFWTARNAIHSWDYLIDGKPLRSHDVEWSKHALPRSRSQPGSLGLKLVPTINLYTRDVLIIAPEWFLSARELQLPLATDSTPSPEVLKLARDVLDDYFRKLLASELLPAEQRTVDVHKSLRTMLDHLPRGMDGRLMFGTYGGARGAQPGAVVNNLMECVRKKLEHLDEWVFFPWKATLLGLLPWTDWRE